MYSQLPASRLLTPSSPLISPAFRAEALIARFTLSPMPTEGSSLPSLSITLTPGREAMASGAAFSRSRTTSTAQGCTVPHASRTGSDGLPRPLDAVRVQRP
ncbi:hypothetical protein AS200_03840 [Streptomyces sp. CdTB01]|nr:hypothetical protein AS200_03840 [Streptomyces sp. CdTB01]